MENKTSYGDKLRKPSLKVILLCTYFAKYCIFCMKEWFAEKQEMLSCTKIVGVCMVYVYTFKIL